MRRPLDITALGIDCEADGGARVAVWCKCSTPDDVDDIIAWLDLAKTLMKQWQEIRDETTAQPEDRTPRAAGADAPTADLR